MGACAFVLGFVITMLGITSATAGIRISHDNGGQIGHYLRQYAMVRSSGESVIIDGPCLSACTLVLGVVPRERICVTSRARLGFHAAWLPDESGRPAPFHRATQLMMGIYPAKIKRWIHRKGGLSSRMIYLRGRELASMYPICR
ncbi:MAG: hypothetical protein M5U07_10690 [Xanthobacteraceae bacterium]|nr:hypothetical protein [Xanthobacteraceae bacterium]